VKVSASDAFQDDAVEASTSAGEECNWTLPDDKDNATSGTADFVATTWRIDDQRAGRMRASGVDLRAVKNEDVLVALVRVFGDVRPRCVL
jgi:hypothetical protein